MIVGENSNANRSQQEREQRNRRTKFAQSHGSTVPAWTASCILIIVVIDVDVVNIIDVNVVAVCKNFPQDVQLALLGSSSRTSRQLWSLTVSALLLMAVAAGF